MYIKSVIVLLFCSTSLIVGVNVTSDCSTLVHCDACVQSYLNTSTSPFCRQDYVHWCTVSRSCINSTESCPTLEEDVVKKLEYCKAYDTSFSEPTAIGISIFVAFFLCLMWIVLKNFLSVKKEFLDIPNHEFSHGTTKRFFGFLVYENGLDSESTTFCRILTSSYKELDAEIIIRSNNMQEVFTSILIIALCGLTMAFGFLSAKSPNLCFIWLGLTISLSLFTYVLLKLDCRCIIKKSNGEVNTFVSRTALRLFVKKYQGFLELAQLKVYALSPYGYELDIYNGKEYVPVLVQAQNEAFSIYNRLTKYMMSAGYSGNDVSVSWAQVELSEHE